MEEIEFRVSFFFFFFFSLRIKRGRRNCVLGDKRIIIMRRRCDFARTGIGRETRLSRSKAQYLLENEPVISGHIIIEINDSQCTCLAFEMDTR